MATLTLLIEDSRERYVLSTGEWHYTGRVDAVPALSPQETPPVGCWVHDGLVHYAGTHSFSLPHEVTVSNLVALLVAHQGVWVVARADDVMHRIYAVDLAGAVTTHFDVDAHEAVVAPSYGGPPLLVTDTGAVMILAPSSRMGNEVARTSRIDLSSLQVGYAELALRTPAGAWIYVSASRTFLHLDAVYFDHLGPLLPASRQLWYPLLGVDAVQWVPASIPSVSPERDTADVDPLDAVLERQPRVQAIHALDRFVLLEDTTGLVWATRRWRGLVLWRQRGRVLNVWMGVVALQTPSGEIRFFDLRSGAPAGIPPLELDAEASRVHLGVLYEG